MEGIMRALKRFFNPDNFESGAGVALLLSFCLIFVAEWISVSFWGKGPSAAVNEGLLILLRFVVGGVAFGLVVGILNPICLCMLLFPYFGLIVQAWFTGVMIVSVVLSGLLGIAVGALKSISVALDTSVPVWQVIVLVAVPVVLVVAGWCLVAVLASAGDLRQNFKAYREEKKCRRYLIPAIEQGNAENLKKVCQQHKFNLQREYQFSLLSQKTINSYPLFFAAYYAQTHQQARAEALAMVNVLKEVGAVEGDCLSRAIKDKYSEASAVLLEAGADVNVQNRDGETALMLAIENGDQEAVRKLIEAGADVNVQNSWDKTALILAAKKGDRWSLQKLIEAGADVNVQNRDGETALMLAVKRGDQEAVRKLIEAGADVNVQDRSGNTALMMVAKNGDQEAVQKLIEEGADVNLQDRHGYTALINAVKNGDQEAVQKLIEAGADVNLPDTEGGTALMSAAYGGNTEAVRKLIEFGADVNLQNIDGNTALMLAANRENAAAVKVLLAAGADVNVANKKKETAWILAEKRYDSEIVELLKAAGAK